MRIPWSELPFVLGPVRYLCINRSVWRNRGLDFAHLLLSWFGSPALVEYIADTIFGIYCYMHIYIYVFYLYAILRARARAMPGAWRLLSFTLVWEPSHFSFKLTADLLLVGMSHLDANS